MPRLLISATILFIGLITSVRAEGVFATADFSALVDGDPYFATLIATGEQSPDSGELVFEGIATSQGQTVPISVTVLSDADAVATAQAGPQSAQAEEIVNFSPDGLSLTKTVYTITNPELIPGKLIVTDDPVPVIQILIAAAMFALPAWDFYKALGHPDCKRVRAISSILKDGAWLSTEVTCEK